MARNSFLRKIRKKAKAVSATAAVLALALSGCSVSTSSTAAVTGKAGTSIEGAVELFDANAAHNVSIVWDEDDYDTMIAAYETDSDKAWISADITIDGTLIKNVGVRLKGNSTLRSLGGAQSGGGGMGQGGAADGTMPTDLPTDMAGGMGGRGGTPPEGAGGTMPTDMPTDMAKGGVGGAPGGMGDSSNISADDPASLPLLIRFDKYVDGTEYEGLTQLALRPGTPVINEALALSVTAATGQSTQRYAYTTYSVNGSATQTRLLLENPDEAYGESIDDGNSVVFKADADSSFSYQGDDLSVYEDQFKQLNKTDTQDATPIVAFLKWLDGADDATFDAELANWVDVDSFAKYVATQNLLANSDDMAGPGQNYYLSYDLSTKKISVISWDLNLALSGNATASPDESLSMGGGGMGGKGGGLGGNSLKTRFLASDTFKLLYDSAYQELYTQVFAEGTAQSLLASITESIPASDDLTKEEIAEKSKTLGTFLTQRGEALEKALAN
ncbi:Spore coat protein CotH [Arthrobacter alpinus]|uniref:Spore coat protein CotH n=1 Tax=Arthrobacter alpinus TaxID=656366 RepID=A0A1H5N2J3_9MICC|nr:CotH kinase family protein [Arthrobacter alpinus]SEE95815.1 Spore coat protein CotH [Arthrobacter alpinus]